MLQTVGAFIGGLGLFLLAVSMISEGLRLAAGNTLRDILALSTRTRLRGLISGAGLTALVQSSSAVTLSTIGFVNAGLLAMPQALGIVMGATIGTTMTGWLVAAVGFEFQISSFALPLIGLGMLMRLVGPNRRMGAIGEAIAGFGLFFIGVDILRGAFEGAVGSFDLANLSPDGLPGVLMFLLVGMVMTMLTQSSSASLAITLTAATGGMISFAAAAAMVIGATVGTTSTSALAVIGATPNAKRVAAAHVIINSTNALVGLLMLPLLLWLVASRDDSSILGNMALTLAMFHTSFNFCGVVLLQPFVNRLSRFLEARFRSSAEEVGKPQHLDSNILASPQLALDAFFLELTRMADMARVHNKAALAHTGPPGRELQEQYNGLLKLVDAVEHFVATLESERLHKDVALQLPMILRISNYIEEAVSLAQDNARHDADVDYLMQSSVGAAILGYQQAVLGFLERCDPLLEGFSAEALELDYQSLRQQWRELKTNLLNAGVNKQLPMSRLNPAIDNLRITVRVAERSTRIAVRMAELAQLLSGIHVQAAEPLEEAAVVEVSSGKADVI